MRDAVLKVSFATRVPVVPGVHVLELNGRHAEHEDFPFVVRGAHVLLVVGGRYFGFTGGCIGPRVPVEDAVEVGFAVEGVVVWGGFEEARYEGDVAHSLLQVRPLLVADGFAAKGGYERLAVVLVVGLLTEEGLQVLGVCSRVVEVVVVERKEQTKAQLVRVLEETINGVCGPRFEMIFNALVGVERRSRLTVPMFIAKASRPNAFASLMSCSQ